MWQRQKVQEVLPPLRISPALLPCLLKEDTPRAGTVGGFSDPQHWIRPFVLSFIPAVALGTCALPLMAGAWAAVARWAMHLSQAATWTRLPLSTGTSVHQGEVSKSRSARVLSVAR